MDNIGEYLERTKSAVVKLFEAYDTYWELLQKPEMPTLPLMGNDDSLIKWESDNKEILEERIKREKQFLFESFAMSTLKGTILQFAYWGIEKFSKNNVVPEKFKDIIEPISTAVKFCIGRDYDGIPIGLIIYAGRNQAIHFNEQRLRPVSSRVFEMLTTWYSPTLKKWMKSDYFDLDNPNLINYAENICHILDWNSYNAYEKDMRQMLSA